MDTTTYDCPGLQLAQPQGWVACYRAGHPCPPKVAIVTNDKHGRTTTHRCPCCGDFGGSIFMPHEWLADRDRSGVSAIARGEGA